MLPVTVWMNYPSFYQGDLYRELVSSGEVDIEVVFAKNLTPDRLELGWQDDLAGYPHRFIDRSISAAVRLARSQRDRIHIVNGLWAEPSFAAALLTLALSGSAYAIYSEAPDPWQHRSAGKRLLQTSFGKTLVGRAVGVLPVSSLAVDFYKRLGVPDKAIYPFGYFRSGERWVSRSTHSDDRAKIEIIFAGQIVYRKGLDLLIDATKPLFEQHGNLFLTIIGTGEMKSKLQDQAEACGLTDRILFEGVIPPEKIPARLAKADLLVLPSRWDGWGVVVNEAFSVGLPVIVSDSCGASDLVNSDLNGYVFRSGDADDLRACLSSFLSRKAFWPHLRAGSLETGAKISTEEAAPYLIECIRHMMGLRSQQPAPPWMRMSVIEGADL